MEWTLDVAYSYAWPWASGPFTFLHLDSYLIYTSISLDPFPFHLESLAVISP